MESIPNRYQPRSMAAAAVSTEALHDVLKRWGTSRFHIEFPAPSANDPSRIGLFFSSHMLHAVVALHGLGASLERLQEHAKSQESMLSPAEKDDPSVELTWEQCKAIMGQKKHRSFPAVSRFFLQEMKTRSAGEVVAQYLPQMLDGGIHTSLFHPFIHIGYGLISQRQQEVADGLSYMVMSCRPTQPAPDDDLAKSLASTAMPLETSVCGKGSHPALLLLSRLRQDQRLHKVIAFAKQQINSETIARETGRGALSHKIFKVLDYAEPILKEHAELVGLLSAKADCTAGALQRVFEAAALAYTLVRPADDFFLLHGLTSAWMMVVIAPHLSQSDQQIMLQQFCFALAATYAARDFPELSEAPFPKTEDVPSWDEIIKVAVADDDLHTAKVVYSCREAEKKFGPLVQGAPLYRMISACRVGLLSWP